MKFQTISEIETWLEPYAAIAYETTGKSITLERTVRFAKHVGNPQEKLRVVHVAGTSGKTSTCYYTAALLGAAGAKTGLTVSPHIDSLTERVQINGRPLDEATFCEYFSEFSTFVEHASERPTYFELMMVFAYWVFAEKEQVDYAVIETGLGGMEDSSNIARRGDKVCVLTDIGLDHMHVLGSTLGEIAAQKAGIMWPENEAFCYRQDEEVMRAFETRAAQVGAHLHVVDSATGEDFAARNWQLAWTTFAYMTSRDGLSITEEEKQKTQRIYIPARMDIMNYEGKTIVFDGAHNEQKMSAFLMALDKRFPGMSKAFLVGFKLSKDVDAPLRMIAQHTKVVIATGFQRYQDTPMVAIDPHELAAKLDGEAEVYEGSVEAFGALLEHEADLYIVTGSFYLISELRRGLGLKP